MVGDPTATCVHRRLLALRLRGRLYPSPILPSSESFPHVGSSSAFQPAINRRRCFVYRSLSSPPPYLGNMFCRMLIDVSINTDVSSVSLTAASPAGLPAPLQGRGTARLTSLTLISALAPGSACAKTPRVPQNIGSLYLPAACLLHGSPRRSRSRDPLSPRPAAR